jgi:hypothetical protein
MKKHNSIYTIDIRPNDLTEIPVPRILLPCGSRSFVFASGIFCKTVKITIYKTIILSFVLYGCETWSVTLREEHRLRVFENRVLRGIFGPAKDEMTEGWTNLEDGGRVGREGGFIIRTRRQLLLRLQNGRKI